MNFFVIILLWQHILYLCMLFLVQGDTLVRNCMCSLMMISDMLLKHVGAVKSVLKKWFKINDIQLVHLLVVWYLVNLQDARCNNKDSVKIVFNYDRGLLLGSFVEIVCCDVIYFQLLSVKGKLLFRGAPFLWCM